MITATIIQALTAALVEPTVPVYGEEPESPPKTYILVEKTGGSGEAYLRQATIALKCYAESLAKAEELAERVLGLTWDLADGNIITDVNLAGGPYNYTDTRTHRYRYQIVLDVHHY